MSLEEMMGQVIRADTREQLGETPKVTIADILRAKRKLEGVKRIVICHPSHREMMEAEIANEGLTENVKVITSLECEPGTAYVARAELL